jgi:hypothetical protein
MPRSSKRRLVPAAAQVALAAILVGALGAAVAPLAALAAAGTAIPADDAIWALVKDLARTPATLSGEPGRYFAWDNQYGRTSSQFTHGGITKAQGEAWDQQMQAITAFLRQAPVLAQPAGFFPQMFGFITVLNAGIWNDRPRQAPLAGGVALAVWPPRDVQIGADGSLKSKEELSLFRLELNYVYPPAGQNWMRDEQGSFAGLQKQGEFAGFPIYGNALHLTCNGRLPYLPVSQERVLRAFIAGYKDERKTVEQRLSERRKAYDEYVRPERVA